VIDRRVKLRLMHAQDARFVFVRVMGVFWIRTDACVAFVACPACKAPLGAACTGNGEGAKTETHHLRRRAATKLLRQQAEEERDEREARNRARKGR
jgi:hypothetical protein